MQDRKVAYVLTFKCDKCDADILFFFDNIVPLSMTASGLMGGGREQLPLQKPVQPALELAADCDQYLPIRWDGLVFEWTQ